MSVEDPGPLLFREPRGFEGLEVEKLTAIIDRDSLEDPAEATIPPRDIRSLPDCLRVFVYALLVCPSSPRFPRLATSPHL
jgi:hypothetical protein